MLAAWRRTGQPIRRRETTFLTSATQLPGLVSPIWDAPARSAPAGRRLRRAAANRAAQSGRPRAASGDKPDVNAIRDPAATNLSFSQPSPLQGIRGSPASLLAGPCRVNCPGRRSRRRRCRSIEAGHVRRAMSYRTAWRQCRDRHRCLPRSRPGWSHQAVRLSDAYWRAPPRRSARCRLQIERAPILRLDDAVTPQTTFRLAAKYDLIAVELGPPISSSTGRRPNATPTRSTLRHRGQSIVYPVRARRGQRRLPWVPCPEQVEMRYWFTAAPASLSPCATMPRSNAANHARLQRLLADIWRR